MNEFLQYTIQGLAAGSFYALAALGLAIIFGVLGVVNFAHGAVYMLGAVTAAVLLDVVNLNFWLALIVVPVVMFVFGVLIERLLVSRLIALDPLYNFLLTFGLTLLLVDLVKRQYGVSGLPYTRPDLLTGQIERLVERVEQVLRDPIDDELVDDVLDEDRELVATEPGDRVARPQAGREALRDRDQQLVAEAVTEPVVDDLELVEVDEQERDRLTQPPSVDDPLALAFEMDPVGKRGDRIVERHRLDVARRRHRRARGDAGERPQRAAGRHHEHPGVDGAEAQRGHPGGQAAGRGDGGRQQGAPDVGGLDAGRRGDDGLTLRA